MKSDTSVIVVVGVLGIAAIVWATGVISEGLQDVVAAEEESDSGGIGSILGTIAGLFV